MAKLEVTIGADKTDFDKKIKEVEFDVKQLAKIKQEQIKLGLNTTEITAQLKDAKKSLTDFKNTARDAGNSVSGMAPKVANGSNALIQFSRIAQDAPYGIIGVGNNITATAEAFSYLRNQTGSTGGALKALGSSLMGTGGILLAVSLVTTAFTLMSQSGLSVGDVFRKLTGDFGGYADALKKVNEAAYNDSGVQKAISNLNELKINIDLAKNGFLNKKQVVDQYNETIGKTTGLVNDLDEAEKAITKNGDAYIKMTLYKAAANLALEEAGKEQLKAEQVRIKKLSDFTNAFLDADLTQTRSKEQFDAKERNLQAQQAKRKLKEVKINEDAANANLSIASKFQAQAAKIAKDFNFNLFGDTKAPKAEKTTARANVSGISIPTIIDNEKIKNEGKKVVKLLEESLGSALDTFKKTPIPLDIPLQPVIPVHVITEMEQSLLDFNDSASNIINNSIANTFADLGMAIGQGLASGGNIMKSAGNALLAGLGGVLTELGKLAISTGVGILAVQLALKTLNPYVAIAAGVALVALGATFSSKASGLGSSKGMSSGGGGSPRAGNSYQSPSASGGGSSFSGGSGGSVVFEISGQSLIGVLSNSLDKNRRLGGNLGIV